MSEGAQPTWRKGEPLTAAKLNECNARNLQQGRVGPGLQITRNGSDFSLILNGPQYKAPVVRAEVTELPDPESEYETPDTYGCTPWDGTNPTSAQVYAKMLAPHSVGDDVLICQPYGGTDQTDPNGLPVTWIEIDSSPDVVVQIVSKITGAGGKYNGTIYSGVMTDAGTGNLALPEGLTSGQNCLVLNADEDGQPTHWLLTGSSYNYAAGVFWGMSTEAMPRPIILIERGRYRIGSPQQLSCPAPNVDSAATDSWDRKIVTAGNAYGDCPVSMQMMTRMGYNPADTTPVLGYFYRIKTYAADGRLDTTGPETFVSVNTPDSCSS